MKTYGIDTGTAPGKTVLVSLDNTQLTGEPPLAPTHGGIPPGLTAVQATALAHDIAAEILQRGLFPLAIDAALTCAATGDPRRRWETFYRGSFATPDDAQLNTNLSWHCLAKVWSRVAVILQAAGQVLWYGQELTAAYRKSLVIEVYPRTAWICCHAKYGHPIGSAYGRQKNTWRDAVLGAAGLQWTGKHAGLDAKDAGVAALVLDHVISGQGRYLGEAVIPAPGPAVMTGGGIALF